MKIDRTMNETNMYTNTQNVNALALTIVHSAIYNVGSKAVGDVTHLQLEQGYEAELKIET